MENGGFPNISFLFCAIVYITERPRVNLGFATVPSSVGLMKHRRKKGHLPIAPWAGLMYSKRSLLKDWAGERSGGSQFLPGRGLLLAGVDPDLETLLPGTVPVGQTLPGLRRNGNHPPLFSENWTARESSNPPTGIIRATTLPSCQEVQSKQVAAERLQLAEGIVQ